MGYLLLVLASMLVTVPAYALTTDGQEDLCDDPRVIFCENFEGRALGGSDLGRSTYKNLGWANLSNGQVTTNSAAVRSDSKGFELFFPEGYNVGPGYLVGNFASRTLDVYVREYYKVSSNFVWSQAGNKRSKIGNLGGNDIHVLQQISSGVAWADTTQDGYPRALENRVTGGIVPPGYPNAGAEDNYLIPTTIGTFKWFERDTWYCVETHMRANSTPTTADGLFEVWVDGQLTASLNNIIIDRFSTGIQREWAVFWMDGYANCWGNDVQPPGSGDCSPGEPVPAPTPTLSGFPLNKPSGSWHRAQSRYYDNIVAATFRVGCLGSPPPPSDTTPPSQVTGLVATAGNASVTLSGFSANDDNGSIGVYNIRQATAPGGPFTTIAQTGGAPNGVPITFVVSGLTNGTPYYFQVAAQDPSGNVGPFSVVVTATPQAPPPSGNDTVLSLNGAGGFQINGVNTFLLGISYFDGSTLHTSDLDYLDARGFNYLRVFCEDVGQVVAKDCFNSNGTLKAGKVAQLHSFIDAADDRGMVVQMVCLYGDEVSDSSDRIPLAADRTTAITNCVNEFKTHSNVWFDLVNEHNGTHNDWASSHPGTMTTLMNAALAACPACIIGYSSADGAEPNGHIWNTPGDVGSDVNPTFVSEEVQSGSRVILPHDKRYSGWELDAFARLSNLRAWLNANSASQIAVVLDEPGREGFGGLGSAAAYIKLAQDTKASGASGFLFHTGAAFDVDSATMVSQLGAVDLAVVDTLAASLTSPTATARHVLYTAAFAGTNADIGAEWDPGYTGHSAHTLVSGKVRPSGTNTETVESYNGGTLPLLDTCVRANEGPPPSASWVTSGGGAGLKVISNLCGTNAASGTNDDAATWNTSQDFSANIIKWQATLDTPPPSGGTEYFIIGIQQSSNTTTTDGYRWEGRVVGGPTPEIKAYEYNAGTPTLKGTYQPGGTAFPSNQVYAIIRNVATGAVNFYIDGQLIPNLSFTDSTFTADGYNFIGSYASNTVRWKDIRGGIDTTTTVPANQWIAVPMSTLTGAGGQQVRATVHMAAPATYNGDDCRATRNPSVFGQTNTSEIRVKVEASGTTLLVGDANHTWAAGETVVCEKVGDTINMYYVAAGGSPVTNAVLLLSGTSGTNSTGRPAFYLLDTASAANLEVGNVVIGDVVPVTVVTPAVTALTISTTGATATITGTYSGCRLETALGATVYTLASGQCTTLVKAWQAGDDFACLKAIDSSGTVIDTPASSYLCAATDAFVIADTTAPVISNGAPTGTLAAGTTSTTVSWTTNEAATCRWGTSDAAYASLPNAATGSLTHSATFGGLVNNTAYTVFVRCQDAAGNTNSTSYSFGFSVAAGGADSTAPVLSGGAPAGVQPSGTTQVTMQIQTNEAATCKYGTVPGTAYASIANTFTTTGGTNHQQVITGLSDGNTYTYYVRCQDAALNANGSDYTISWSVTASPPDVSPPVRSSGSPTGTVTSTTVTVSLNTNEIATCRYSLSSGVAYASMTLEFQQTADLFHATVLTGLSVASHTVYVRCIDVAGNVNTTDFTITFIVQGTPPSVITNHAAVLVSTTQITYANDLPMDDVQVQFVRLWHCLDQACTSRILALTVQGPATLFTITNLTPDTTYTTCVTAVDTSGTENSCSNTFTATTLPQSSVDTNPPSTLANLRVSGTPAYNLVVLLWDAGTDLGGSGLQGAILERCVGVGCTDFTLYEVSTVGALNDANVLPLTTYRYRGKWSDGAGNTSISYSNIVDVTTPALPSGITQGLCRCDRSRR